MKHLAPYLHNNPVIAAIRNTEDVEYALTTSTIALMFLSGDIFSLESVVERVREMGKLVFLHAEMIGGIAQDRAGVRYTAKRLRVDGIITIKKNLINYARDEGLMTVQRLFVLDSAAAKTGIELVRQAKPDAVEVLPGVAAPYLAQKLKGKLDVPIIAGGLIETRDDVRQLLKKDVLAVSTSTKKLWNYPD